MGRWNRLNFESFISDSGLFKITNADIIYFLGHHLRVKGLLTVQGHLMSALPLWFHFKFRITKDENKKADSFLDFVIIRNLNFKILYKNQVRGVFQKFCIAQPFSTCGDTAALKLHAHVTEGIPSAYAKFCSCSPLYTFNFIVFNILKQWQYSVVCFIYWTLFSILYWTSAPTRSIYCESPLTI